MDTSIGSEEYQYQLSESVAIFRYLIGRDRQHHQPAAALVADHWYPADLRQRGSIDEYLEWQHTNTREACSYYFILKYLKPRTTGREPGDDQVVGSALRQMEKTLDKLENLWLADAGDEAGFLAGQKEISIADLLAAAELEQPRKIIRWIQIDTRSHLTNCFVRSQALRATNRVTADQRCRPGCSAYVHKPSRTTRTPIEFCISCSTRLRVQSIRRQLRSHNKLLSWRDERSTCVDNRIFNKLESIELELQNFHLLVFYKP